jgi:hypothetical protein
VIDPVLHEPRLLADGVAIVNYDFYRADDPAIVRAIEIQRVVEEYADGEGSGFYMAARCADILDAVERRLAEPTTHKGIAEESDGLRP